MWSALGATAEGSGRIGADPVLPVPAQRWEEHSHRRAALECRCQFDRIHHSDQVFLFLFYPVEHKSLKQFMMFEVLYFYTFFLETIFLKIWKSENGSGFQWSSKFDSDWLIKSRSLFQVSFLNCPKPLSDVVLRLRR